MIKKFKTVVKKVNDVYKTKQVLSTLPSEEKELIQKIRDKKLTYLSVIKLHNILKTCKALEASKTEGIFLEAGCALGGSSILISKIKTKKRPCYIYDVFGMIPPPTKEDTSDVHERYKTIVEGKSTGLGGDKYYGYEDSLFEKVQQNLKDFDIDLEKDSVSMIKGLVQETMDLETTKVAFAHIDVDWYDPVMTCLQRIWPRLSVGGSIILDDYFVWGGCTKATDEFLIEITGQYQLDDSSQSLKITKL